MFLSDAPELFDDRRETSTPGVGVYGSEMASSSTLPSVYGECSSSGVHVAGTKRPFVTEDVGEKRHKMDLEGEEEEVSDRLFSSLAVVISSLSSWMFLK